MKKYRTLFKKNIYKQINESVNYFHNLPVKNRSKNQSINTILFFSLSPWKKINTNK